MCCILCVLYYLCTFCPIIKKPVLLRNKCIIIITILRFLVAYNPVLTNNNNTWTKQDFNNPQASGYLGDYDELNTVYCTLPIWSVAM